MPRLSTALLAGFALMMAGRLPAQDPAAPIRTLTLPEAIAIALEQGNSARAARATRDAARYRNRAFGSRLLPQLSLGGQVPKYNRSIIPVLQPDGSTLFRSQEQTDAALTATLAQKLPLIGGDLTFTSSLARLSLSGAQSRESWSATPFSVGLRQEVLRPNLSAWQRREQGVQAELAERQYLEAREDIALQATNQFFDVYAARVARDRATKNAAVNDTLYKLNRGRFEVAKIGENDLLQSELALLRAQTALDGARLEEERTLASLRLALNLPESLPIEIVADGIVPAIAADTARAVAEAMRNRAAIREAELQTVQANRRLTEARLANGVGATIQASYGLNAVGPEANLAYQNLLEARQFSVSVQFPLWQWGAHGKSVDAAEADRDRVASTTETSLGQVRLDARFAVLQLDQARRTLALSAKADTVARKRFDVAYNRYVVGRIAIDNLYQAQGEEDQARTQFVQALRGYWQAHYRLRRATLFDFATGEVIR